MSAPPPRSPTSSGWRANRCAKSARRSAATGSPTLEKELEGARVALSAAGIEAEFDRAPVTLDVEAVLAWAVREGATNVIRHSGARHCQVTVKAGLADAAVEVVDDGGWAGVGGQRSRRPRNRWVALARGAAARPDRGRPPARSAVASVWPCRSRCRWRARDPRAHRRGPEHGPGRAGHPPSAWDPDIEVVSQVARGDEVLMAARSAQPDIALFVTLRCRAPTGLDAAEELARELPDCRVLILTTFGRPGTAPGHGGRRVGVRVEGRPGGRAVLGDPARLAGASGWSIRA